MVARLPAEKTLPTRVPVAAVDRRLASATPGARLLHLQRTAGNRAVADLLTRLRAPESEPKPEPKPPASAGTAVVQRRVGFEFESVEPKWRFQGRDLDSERWAGISRTKKKLLWTASRKAGVSADNGNVEFVTEPLSSWDEVELAIGELQALAAKIQRKPERTRSFEPEENATASVDSGKTWHRIVAASTLVTKPQATIGVSLLGVADLFATLRELAGSADTMERRVGNTTTTYETERSDNDAAQWVKNAVEKYQRLNPDDPAKVGWPLHRDEAHGLLTMILKVLWDAFSNSGPGLTDPKYAFPMMPRTHFKAMIGSMKPSSQTAIRALWDSGALRDTFAFGLDAAVFHGGYKGADKKGVPKGKRTTKGEWLESIFSNKPEKDLLSPPVGYRGQPEEGLGAMETDTDIPRLILLELRHVTNGEPITPDQWLALARVVASIDAVQERQPALRPPP